MRDAFGFEIETDICGAPKVTFTRARVNTGYLNSVDSSTLTVEELRSIIHYDPETGVWTWKISQQGYVQRGRVAGNIDKFSGYRRVCINHILYRSSRLAWLYMTGKWPPVTVDHDNRNRSDDRWNNLRLATATQNSMNIDVRADNASGFKGVYLQRFIRKISR
jgi:HNH endonuclease